MTLFEAATLIGTAFVLPFWGAIFGAIVALAARINRE